jgi:hypothetical protein
MAINLPKGIKVVSHLLTYMSGAMEKQWPYLPKNYSRKLKQILLVGN